MTSVDASTKRTKSVDIFKLDYVCIPVALEAHYALFVLVRPGKVHGSQDGTDDQPCILYLDSLPNTFRQQIKEITGTLYQ
jgi:Ulp1 family protease